MFIILYMFTSPDSKYNVVRSSLMVCLKLLHQHLVGVLRVHLLLLELAAEVLELVLELLEHLHDARGLEPQLLIRPNQ